MEQLNSDNVAINSDKSSTVKIQVSTHFQRNGRRKLEDRYVVENDLNSTFDLDVSFIILSFFSNLILIELNLIR